MFGRNNNLVELARENGNLEHELRQLDKELLAYQVTNDRLSNENAALHREKRNLHVVCLAALVMCAVLFALLVTTLWSQHETEEQLRQTESELFRQGIPDPLLWPTPPMLEDESSLVPPLEVNPEAPATPTDSQALAP